MCVPLITQLLLLWEGWEPVIQVNHFSLVPIVSQTDSPKSVRNCCVIEISVVFFLCCHVALLCFSVGVGAFMIGLSRITSIFTCLLSMMLVDVWAGSYLFLFYWEMHLYIRITMLFRFFLRKVWNYNSTVHVCEIQKINNSGKIDRHNLLFSIHVLLVKCSVLQKIN